MYNLLGMKQKNDWTCLIVAIIAVIFVILLAKLDEKFVVKKYQYSLQQSRIEAIARIALTLKKEIERAGGPANYYKNLPRLKYPSYRYWMWTYILAVWFAGFMAGCLFIMAVNGIKERIK